MDVQTLAHINSNWKLVSAVPKLKEHQELSMYKPNQDTVTQEKCVIATWSVFSFTVI
jgi:hypothetical protein